MTQRREFNGLSVVDGDVVLAVSPVEVESDEEPRWVLTWSAGMGVEETLVLDSTIQAARLVAVLEQLLGLGDGL